jgi:4-aminobutyrate aminotransferase-like enzyme
MTSTHTGNPICCAAALANIDIIEEEGLVDRARETGEVLHQSLKSLWDRYPEAIGAIHGKGLVAGIHMVKQGTEEPDGDLAFKIIEECVRRGLLMFSPVGYGGGTVKISPPLVIAPEAVLEGVEVLDEAIQVSLTS